MGFYVQAGDWTLLPSQSQYSASFGAVGGVGFLYELQAGKKYSSTQFLFDLGVGAWGGMTDFVQGSNKLVELENQKDLQGDNFNYVYNIRSRQDIYTNIAVQVPVLVGLQHNAFYMLAGVKFDANVLSKAHTKMSLSTYGRYQEFGIVGQSSPMPEYQFFAEERLSKKADASLKLNINLSLEMGGRIGLITSDVGYDVPRRKTECRLAGFVDFGISDIHTSRSLPDFVTPTTYNIDPASSEYVYNTRTMVDNLQMNDIMSTTGFAAKVNSLVVGVKFTMLFQLPQESKGTLYYNTHRSSVRRRSGGVKYEE